MEAFRPGRDDVVLEALLHQSSPDSTQLLPSNPGEKLFTEDEWRQIGHHLCFSERQLCIARMLAAGKTLNTISKELVTSPHTVRVHMKRIFKKAQVKTKLDLVVQFVLIHRLLKDLCQESITEQIISNRFMRLAND
jgi:DNA-binding NarL/FixJ family response regulator